MAGRGKKKSSHSRRPSKQAEPTVRSGRAPAHPKLVNEHVHVFVDDQNLFWGIVNANYGPGFRIDFGRLLLNAAKSSNGTTRGVLTAYIAGVIPDDDSFWKVAENKGFTVRRGYLGANNRSKQDDAHLITDLMATIYEQEGPSTIVLVAGDADYFPPLERALQKGWRTEVAFVDRGVSVALEAVTHEIRVFNASSIQHLPGFN